MHCKYFFFFSSFLCFLFPYHQGRSQGGFFGKFLQFARVFWEKKSQIPPKIFHPYKKIWTPPRKISGYAPAYHNAYSLLYHRIIFIIVNLRYTMICFFIFFRNILEENEGSKSSSSAEKSARGMSNNKSQTHILLKKNYIYTWCSDNLVENNLLSFIFILLLCW